MSQLFDPWHKWLGISPKDQPPNHYRLLGIDLYEADIDVIRDAAERQMAHVRTYQLGQYAEFSQKILNELAAARSCLLNSKEKTVYDEALKQRFAISRSKEDTPKFALPASLEVNNYSEAFSSESQIPPARSLGRPQAEADLTNGPVNPLSVNGNQVKGKSPKIPRVETNSSAYEIKQALPPLPDLGSSYFQAVESTPIRLKKLTDNAVLNLLRHLSPKVWIGTFLAACLAFLLCILLFLYLSTSPNTISLDNTSNARKPISSAVSQKRNSSALPKAPVMNHFATSSTTQPGKRDQSQSNVKRPPNAITSHDQNIKANINPIPTHIPIPQNAQQNIIVDKTQMDRKDLPTEIPKDDSQRGKEILVTESPNDSLRNWTFKEYLENDSVRLMDKSGNVKTVSYLNQRLEDQEYIASLITNELMEDCSKLLAYEQLLNKYDKRPFLFKSIVVNKTDNYFNEYSDDVIKDFKSNHMNLPRIAKVKTDLSIEHAPLPACYLVLKIKDAAIVKKDDLILIKGLLGFGQRSNSSSFSPTRVLSTTDKDPSCFEIIEGGSMPILGSSNDRHYSRSKDGKTNSICFNNVKLILSRNNKIIKALEMNDPLKDLQNIIQKQVLANRSMQKRQASQQRINQRRSETQDDINAKKRMMGIP